MSQAVSDKAALAESWIGEHYANRKLREFGETGIGWGKRIKGGEGQSLGLRKGLFVMTSNRDFALMLAGAIAVHRKATVRHVALVSLADYLDAPFDYAEDVATINDTGVLCVTGFYLSDLSKRELLPLRTRGRIEVMLRKRIDSRRSIILHCDKLMPSLEWWHAPFVETLNATFETIDV